MRCDIYRIRACYSQNALAKLREACTIPSKCSDLKQTSENLRQLHTTLGDGGNVLDQILKHAVNDGEADRAIVLHGVWNLGRVVHNFVRPFNGIPKAIELVKGRTKLWTT